jgi:hypothetical protein
MPIVMQYRAANPADRASIADDIINFLAPAIASITQNDTNLTIPQMQHKGVGAASKHLADWVRLLKFDHGHPGPSLLTMTVGAVVSDGTRQ